jgi:hypothetical protein
MPDDRRRKVRRARARAEYGQPASSQEMSTQARLGGGRSGSSSIGTMSRDYPAGITARQRATIPDHQSAAVSGIRFGHLP